MAWGCREACHVHRATSPPAPVHRARVTWDHSRAADSWAESDAIAYANSVLGARTIVPVTTSTSAPTSRMPMCGLHLKEDRKGLIFLRLARIDGAVLRHGCHLPAVGLIFGRPHFSFLELRFAQINENQGGRGVRPGLRFIMLREDTRWTEQ